MVVSEILPGVKVEVKVKGKALKEHEQPGDDEDQERTVTRYVEVVSAENFVVAIKILPTFQFKGDMIKVDVYIDGTLTDDCVLSKGKRSTARWVSDGPDRSGMKYRFAAVETGQFSRGSWIVQRLRGTQQATDV